MDLSLAKQTATNFDLQSKNEELRCKQVVPAQGDVGQPATDHQVQHIDVLENITLGHRAVHEQAGFCRLDGAALRNQPCREERSIRENSITGNWGKVLQSANPVQSKYPVDHAVWQFASASSLKVLWLPRAITLRQKCCIVLYLWVE